jgi:4'-phosphopantetheinyl transferase
MHFTAPRLDAQDIHLWHIDLSEPFPEGECAALTDEEHARAGRFRFDRDRNRFLQGRLALRRLLGLYVGLSPRDVPLQHARYGKPFVDARFAIGFNLAHSGDRALAAVSRFRHVGVDIEEALPRGALEGIARTVFTRDECRALHRRPETERLSAFLTCWTRKEAALKAIGVGLAGEPRDLHAGMEPERARAGDVELESIGGIPGCYAAVAVRAEGSRMRLHDAGRLPAP